MSIWKNMILQTPTVAISDVDFNVFISWCMNLIFEFDICSTLYAKHDYHIINIKELEWYTLQNGLNYHSTLINPQTKEATFALFMGVVGSCWLGEKGNFNKISFTNTYPNSTLSIVLEDSKFIKDYKKMVS